MTNGAFSSPAFRVSVNFADAKVVLGLFGELDGRSAPELDAILEALFARGHDSVVLDMTELGFMDSRGLRVIENTARRLVSLQGALTLRSAPEEVRHILYINGMTPLVRFEFGDSDESRLGPEQIAIARDSRATGVLSDATRPADQTIDMRGAREMLDDTLRLIVNLANVSVGGADGVSVSLLRDGEIMTVAASDETILKMDAGQYATGEGPCLAASIEGRWFHINSLKEETRWPAFVPVARALGIQAILSNPLIAGSQPVGALNIYSRAMAAFGPAEESLASAFAGETSAVLSRAGLSEHADAVSRRLQGALRSREVIAQAQGVVMERANVGEEAAFDRLRRFAQRSNRPLLERAEDLVASTRWPEPEEEQIVQGRDE